MKQRLSNKMMSEALKGIYEDRLKNFHLLIFDLHLSLFRNPRIEDRINEIERDLAKERMVSAKDKNKEKIISLEGERRKLMDIYDNQIVTVRTRIKDGMLFLRELERSIVNPESVFDSTGYDKDGNYSKIIHPDVINRDESSRKSVV